MYFKGRKKSVTFSVTSSTTFICFVLFLSLLLTGCRITVQSNESNPQASSSDQIEVNTNSQTNSQSNSQIDSENTSQNEPISTDANFIAKSTNKPSPSNQTHRKKETSTSKSVWLRVSKQFGTERVDLIEEKISTKKISLLSWMRDRLPLETAYGGTFVNGIHGIQSGFTNQGLFSRSKTDWFFYVNGQLSPVGASDVFLKAGDRIVWDYHTWDSGNPAQTDMIGAFPQPFASIPAQHSLSIKTTASIQKNASNPITKFRSWFAAQTNLTVAMTTFDESRDTINSVTQSPEIWILDTKTISKLKDLEKLFSEPETSDLFAPSLPTAQVRAWLQAIRGEELTSQPIWLIVLQEEGDFAHLFELIKDTKQWQGWFGLQLVYQKGQYSLLPITSTIQEEGSP